MRNVDPERAQKPEKTRCRLAATNEKERAMSLHEMNDGELKTVLKKTVAGVRELTADGIAMLAEVGRRGLHVKDGYASLFTYCTGELGFSKNQAWRWSKAAKVAGETAGVLARLRDGRLSLCVVATLADHPELLEWADGILREEAERRIVAAKPVGAKKDIVPAEKAEPVGFEFCAEPKATNASEFCAEPKTPAPRVKRLTVEPTSATTGRVHFDAGEETLSKLRRARELMRGKDVDAVLSAALDALLEKRDPARRHERRLKRQAKSVEKAAKPVKVRAPAAPKAQPKATPVAAKDAAHVASGGRCTWTSRHGKRCEERSYCDHDHIRPRALGGGHEPSNLRLLCRAHHALVTAESFPGWRPGYEQGP